MKLILKILIFLFILLCSSVFIYELSHLKFGKRPVVASIAKERISDVKFIKANSVNFAYIEQGKGELILLFHGFPETARSWKVVQGILAGEGYRVIAVFMRGYPPTSIPNDFSVLSLGKDVVSLIEAFGEEKAIIVGHDWGASAVYEAAFIAPDKVSAMVALAIPHPLGTSNDPLIFCEAPHFLYYQLPWSVRKVWSNDFAHVRSIYKTWSPGFDVPEEEITDIVDTFKVPGAIEASLGYYWAILANGNKNGRLTSDGKISVPSLIISGTQDGTVNPERFNKASEAFENRYSHKILKGVGHFPQMEVPEVVARHILDFITPSN